MKKIIYALFFCLALLLVYCKKELQPINDATASYLNLADSVQYMGMQTCRSCHDNIHQTFQHTGMGRSFDHATLQKTDASFGDHALVYDEQSDFYYKPYFKEDVMYVMEFRLEGKDTVHKRIEKIDYIIGSGQHTNSHILNMGGYVFQAPITYYTQEQRWDMAPGFEKENLRFSRFLTTECITCHNHFPDFEAGSLNKYKAMPRGIECERCHGPGEIHVKEKLAGNIVDTATQIDYTIVNPADLSADLQMDLCQRCHLQGVAVLEEGKTFFDFKPGMQLSEVMNVFLPRYTDSHEKFIMASQADRLRLSNCFIGSKEMSCLTCHNPHRSIEATDKSQYNDACQSCHEKNDLSLCSEPLAKRNLENNNCVACHMPRSGSIDIPHVNITDHYISKSNIKGGKEISTKKKNEIAAFLGLQSLVKKNPKPLDLAKGYIALFDKYVATQEMLDSAKYYLDQSTASFDEKFKTKIHYYFASENYDALIQMGSQKEGQSIEDAWTAYRIGEAYFKKGDYRNAYAYYKQSTIHQPFNLDFQEKLAMVQLSLKQVNAARQTFEFVLKENPKRKVALTNLGYLYALTGNYSKGESLYDQAIALDPDYKQALINKSALLMLRNEKEAARGIINRVLKRYPDDVQAKAALARML